MTWTRSSNCDNGHCLEATRRGDGVRIENPVGVALWTSLPDWQVFADGVRAGDFRADRLGVAT